MQDCTDRIGQPGLDDPGTASTGDPLLRPLIRCVPVLGGRAARAIRILWWNIETVLDIKSVRKNPDAIRNAARLKNIDLDVDRLLDLDSTAVRLQQKLDALRAALKRRSKDFGRLAAEAQSGMREENKRLGDDIQVAEGELRQVETELRQLLSHVPNPPDPSVPIGTSSEENVPIKYWGQPPVFDHPPRDHVQLMEHLGMLDMERGAKVAGTRGYFLIGWGVLLEQALIRFGLDSILRHGFLPMRAPSLIRGLGLFGTGQFPRSREQTYKIEGEELFLTGSADAPLTAFHADEVLSQADLPIKYTAISPCFRREVGSAGRDVRGIFRVHEFLKVEQFVLCEADHDESVKWHERMLGYGEEVVQALELPYRVVNAVTGDLGPAHVKMYDLECWVPSEKRYRENYSDSYFHDWQARRVGVRYRDRNGQIRFCHTLNNTVIATPRILIALTEVHQRPDGGIRIPQALRPYLGVSELTEPWRSDAGNVPTTPESQTA